MRNYIIVLTDLHNSPEIWNYTYSVDFCCVSEQKWDKEESNIPKE